MAKRAKMWDGVPIPRSPRPVGAWRWWHTLLAVLVIAALAIATFFVVAASYKSKHHGCRCGNSYISCDKTCHK